ncbi:DUF917 domain-containing protein [Streptomyces sp. AC512_CC834]|uniref:DUF917 domain-containing protein n=1 Tax=Streptomyces sp. AC512_CC834 TaxID=2823691 RepID=UPI0020B72FED|nr:DUF917 domain-containing protein [Streptomyces sp. AC512_CC834]
MVIATSQIAALERGASLLASGGSGDTMIAADWLRSALAAGHRLPLTAAAALPPQARVVPVGGFGSTGALLEKPPGGDELVSAVAAICRWTGEPADALMTVGLAGFNGLLPFFLGARLGLPWVDADLAGRGLTRLNQASVCAAGRSLAPIAFSETGGELMVVAEGDPSRVERTARAFASGTSGWGMMALAPIPARRLRDCTVLGTVSRALALGRDSLAYGNSPSGLAEFAHDSRGRILGGGRVVEVRRRPGPTHQGRPGFARGTVAVAEPDTRRTLRLEMENEYLVALRDGMVVATTPDVLAVLDRRNGAPVSCDQVRQGRDVVVVQLPASPFWRHPRQGLTLSPRAYGFDCEAHTLP